MSEPTDYVRVTNKDTGNKLTLRRSQLAHGNYTELKAPAVDPRWAALAEFGASTEAAEEPATGSEEAADPREGARNHDYKGEPGQN